MDPAVSAREISRADGCRRAIEAPRGHAKSTTFTFKDSIHAAVYAFFIRGVPGQGRDQPPRLIQRQLVKFLLCCAYPLHERGRLI